MPVSASTTTVTPSRPAEVICSVLAPTASRRFFAISLICLSVTWKGLFSSHLRNSSMPSWIWSERVSMFSMTCQVTNHPIRPITTKPRIAVIAVARPRGTPIRRSRATVGWSSAVISSAATKASTTSWTALMTRISTHSVPARTSSRQPASAATRMPQGTACAGSGRAGTAGGWSGAAARGRRAPSGRPPPRRAPVRPRRGAGRASGSSGSARHPAVRATLALAT